MSILFVQIAVLRTVGLFIVMGCILTAMPAYHLFTVRSSTSVGPSKSHESSTSAQQQQQQQRQRHLQEACSASKDSWSDPGRRFIVSHDLRLVFCVVGKAASTSWARVLLQLTGNPAAQQLAATDRIKVHGTLHRYLEPRSFPNVTQLASAPYKDYFKFMFVREPLERLVSAYRDKMFRANEYRPVQEYIIRRFRRHPFPRSLATADDVLFEEFVRYVLEQAELGQYMDHHWRPQYNLCRPCHINYDFIGHYETLHQNAQHVLRLISHRRLLLTNNTADPVQFPATDLDSRNRNSREFLRKFYDELSPYLVLRLVQVYKKDYKIFGYEFPDIVRQKLNI